MFLVTHIYHDDSDDKTLYPFSDRFKAEKFCVEEIQKIIANQLNMNDVGEAQFAHDINNYVKMNDYRRAILYYDNHCRNVFANPSLYYIDEYKMDNGYSPLFNVPSADGLGVFPESFFTSLSKNNGANAPQVATPTVWKATTPGANCRKCNNHNEFVYADKPDGTYHCRSCKLMADVFGGNDE